MIFRDENIVILPGKAWKCFSSYQWFSKFHSAKEGSALLALIKKHRHATHARVIFFGWVGNKLTGALHFC